VTANDISDEIRRLHEFIVQLANRLADASEVLGMLAERKDKRHETGKAPNSPS
jgi:hypothetical protein